MWVLLMVTDALYSYFRNKERIKLVEWYFIGSSIIDWRSEKQVSSVLEHETKPIHGNMKGEK